MGSHSVTVHQLRGTRYDKGPSPYLNVISDVYKAIGVWGNFYGTSTYLCVRDNDFYLMQFTDDEESHLWFLDNCQTNKGWKRYKLDEME